MTIEPSNTCASVHEQTANELYLDLGFFSSTFLFTLGGKKFIYINNNLANLLQNTCMCVLFIFTQSKKWLTTLPILKMEEVQVTLMTIWIVNPNIPDRQLIIRSCYLPSWSWCNINKTCVTFFALCEDQILT